MSKTWDLVSLDGGDSVLMRMPLYFLTVANVRCHASANDGVVVMLNKVTGQLRIGERATCVPPTK